MFHYEPGDLFSGLRLFSKRFYKNVPLLFRGFELETELTVQAVEKGFRLAEVAVPFRERALGSASKLRTVRDGVRILRLLFVLSRDYRPLVFFGVIALVFFAAGLAAGSLPVYEYYQTRLVGRFPLAILAAGLMNLSLFTLLTGVMLESGLRHRRESYQVALEELQGVTGAIRPRPFPVPLAGRRTDGDLRRAARRQPRSSGGRSPPRGRPGVLPAGPAGGPTYSHRPPEALRGPARPTRSRPLASTSPCVRPSPPTSAHRSLRTTS